MASLSNCFSLLLLRINMLLGANSTLSLSAVSKHVGLPTWHGAAEKGVVLMIAEVLCNITSNTLSTLKPCFNGKGESTHPWLQNASQILVTQSICFQWSSKIIPWPGLFDLLISCLISPLTSQNTSGCSGWVIKGGSGLASPNSWMISLSVLSLNGWPNYSLLTRTASISINEVQK